MLGTSRLSSTSRVTTNERHQSEAGDNEYVSSTRQGASPTCSISSMPGKVILIISGNRDVLREELPTDFGFRGCASMMCGD